jgi:hypothetical protein
MQRIAASTWLASRANVAGGFASLIYTWRREAAGIAACKPVGFSPAILIEQAQMPTPDSGVLLPPPSP